MNKIGGLFLIPFILILVFSCNSDRVFEDYKGMETQSWHIADTVAFDLPQSDEALSSLIGIKYNVDYQFRNLYVKYFLSDSLGNKFESQLLNVSLFDSKEGRPTGAGFGSSYTRFDTLPLQSNNRFSKIEFVQYMRVEELKGIEAIGFKQVEKESNN
ncbi:gliding motility lipoprotein GldH [Belliella sp. DSM 107340]|uniref:Gliding motility lipoprotein GldH n=1 Tax=Belliella calami TaxID=2923436 RepID=A0ABS9UPS6_9BACT|nr:gliding motility lipoprotein GldH [Belliella calami]MCH7398258.1 gliding motility lipoprotein GldH [Belliella calami]